MCSLRQAALEWKPDGCRENTHLVRNRLTALQSGLHVRGFLCPQGICPTRTATPLGHVAHDSPSSVYDRVCNAYPKQAGKDQEGSSPSSYHTVTTMMGSLPLPS